MSKKRVLIIRNAYDKDCGGAEQYALNLCIELGKNGFNPTLMTRVPDLISKATANNVPTLQGYWHSSQEWGKHYFIRLPLMVIWYMYIILRYHFDIIHPQGRDDFIFASIAGGILRKRVVWTDHADLKYILNLKVHPFPYLRAWTIWASRFAYKIICVSNSEKDKITQHAPNSFISKLVTIHNGVFFDNPKKLMEKPQGNLIVANARLVSDKGIGELLEAVSRLKQKTSLWVVGGYSGNKKKYESLAQELGIKDRVTFWGYVERPNEYVAAGDIFIHASYHEAFSLAIVEAAMLGKPIIATNVGGAPEIIDAKSGILVPPKDVNALIKATEYLLNNPQIAKDFGTHISKKTKKHFMFDKIVKEKILPLYS